MLGVKFAEDACGDVTAMLNGSITTPFNPLSIFATVEVKRLKSPRVRRLTALLVTQRDSVSDCSSASLKNLQKELDGGINYVCQEPQSDASADASRAQILVLRDKDERLWRRCFSLLRETARRYRTSGNTRQRCIWRDFLKERRDREKLKEKCLELQRRLRKKPTTSCRSLKRRNDSVLDGSLNFRRMKFVNTGSAPESGIRVLNDTASAVAPDEAQGLRRHLTVLHVEKLQLAAVPQPEL
ncbi:unnamed protein product [Lampetra planeri]